MNNSYDVIHLADNEWGNQIMREVAEEWFRDHPECQFVEVREHAGWWLGYHRENLEVIGTANDMAVMRPDRPRPQHFSGESHRREVRPGFEKMEVESLAEYAKAELEAA